MPQQRSQMRIESRGSLSSQSRIISRKRFICLNFDCFLSKTRPFSSETPKSLKNGSLPLSILDFSRSLVCIGVDASVAPRRAFSSFLSPRRVILPEEELRSSQSPLAVIRFTCLKSHKKEASFSMFSSSRNRFLCVTLLSL